MKQLKINLLFVVWIIGTVAGLSFLANDLAQARVSTSSTPPSAGGAATIASGACGATTNGTVVGNNNYGKITIASAATTTCTITYAAALPAAQAACVISAGNSTAIGALVLPYVSSITTAGFVITGAVLASTTFYYHCF